MDYGYQDIYAEFVEETINAEIVEETIEATIVEESINIEISEETLVLEVTDVEEISSEIGAEEITVEVESWSCPQVIEGGGGGGGYIFITDVTASGIVANRIYEEGTIPPNSVLTEATTDTENCFVHFVAEGGAGYSPTVRINETVCSNLQEGSQDRRLFTGSITVTVTETTDVTVTSSTGQSDSAIIHRAEAPPEILSCVIGGYPGTQTAAKQGDRVYITGTVDSSATHVRIVGFEAFQDSGWMPCSGGTFNISGTISGQSGLKGARVYAKNAMGSEGGTFDSSNKITLDQVSPSFLDMGVTFPVGQFALKGVETAIQGTRVSDFTSLSYSSPHGDISVASPSTYEEDKIVQCMAPGDYNDSSINFRIAAYKASNDTSSTFQKVIEVADIAPTVAVTQSVARLRSELYHTITATGDQNLTSPPGVGVPVSGTWQGAGFSGGPKAFTRSIFISDSDARGQGDWFFTEIPSNRAGLPASSISGVQKVGGFTARTLTLPAFGSSVELGPPVTDTDKLQFSWSFKSPMYFHPAGTIPPVVAGWTFNSPNIAILDSQAAASSSQESTITIEEVV